MHGLALAAQLIPNKDPINEKGEGNYVQTFRRVDSDNPPQSTLSPSHPQDKTNNTTKTRFYEHIVIVQYSSQLSPFLFSKVLSHIRVKGDQHTVAVCCWPSIEHSIP